MSRLNPWAAAPAQMQRLVDYATADAADSIEPGLRHLVKIRASQINGCAICLNMHILEARRDGETDARIYMLDAWEEAGLYTAREKAALAWTEALTRLCETRAPDAAYDAMTAQFAPEDAVKLTLMIASINTWNRLGVGFRIPPRGFAPAVEAA